ncbi:PEP-CTERM sorting domain-containing protein [Roseateles sp. LYH14W]|uniref:PEP-CTERM sorting domain-containing protein n=1 Tax=Pelomonas parva TaxID=3299032 RepID=A0ABW7EYV5_9BURK
MKHRSIPFKRMALSAVFVAAAALGTGTNAAIMTGPDNGELFLVVMDPVTAKMSYTLDLGISAKDFWATAQQDVGASLFRTLDPTTDSAFQTFMNAADLATTSWMLLGFAVDQSDETNRTAFTTLTNNGSVAKQTISYDGMRSLRSPALAGTSAVLTSTTISTLNGATNADILASTHDTADHGSAVASKDAGNSLTYFSRNTSFGDSASGSGDGSCFLNFQVCAGNPIGTSSWFYRLTPTLVDPADPAAGIDDVSVTHDEFDNLGGDGYWGFIKDPTSSKHFLSYTLAGANPTVLTSTDAGRFRLSTIDYSAQSGGARLIGGLAADDVAFQLGTVSAVPEPESWGLMLGGLAMLVGARRLRRARQG